MPIRSLNWSLASPELAQWWGPADGTLLAIWPSPVNADACFTKAGFTDFNDDDLDRAWDEEFEKLTSLLVQRLSSFGAPVVRFGTPHGSIEAALLEATGKDTQICVAPCIVDFGNPLRVSLCTCDEHPIWWLKISPGLFPIEPMLQEMAGGRPLERRSIDLAVLAPSPDHPGLQLKEQLDRDAELYSQRDNRRVKILVGAVMVIFFIIILASVLKRW